MPVTLPAVACVAASLVGIASAAWGALPADGATIESVTGLKGTWNAKESVFKVSKPRDDVKVMVDRVAMPPFMGLTSYAAFAQAGNELVLMGDTVLLEDEVDAAMSAALDAGLEVTALHNHFFYDQPKIWFIHIAGMGDARRLASGVKAVYDRVAQVRANQSEPASGFADEVASPSAITAAPLEAILGLRLQSQNGMAKATVGYEARMHGASVDNEMGVNTWAAFAGSDERAVVDGDFAMREDELQPVLK
ncbi:MAG TPA: DUF1259 domain-containing protein, partial [Caldimonas sp.]|nr:DUF1259 domain-containing protein [Caldimonas sp.]